MNPEDEPPALEPCDFCGYPFDQDLLGYYGCPNCCGELVEPDGSDPS
jgi:hypothetical protein